MSWTVVDKVRRVTNEDAIWKIAEIFTLGLLESEPTYIYTVEDDYGNRKDVVAHDNYDLGEQIAEGDFAEFD